MDNSEWTRNSDYAPTRFQAQADCVNLLAGAKTQANPENTVGVITMAGKAPQVLVTPTPDLGKVWPDNASAARLPEWPQSGMCMRSLPGTAQRIKASCALQPCWGFCIVNKVLTPLSLVTHEL